MCVIFKATILILIVLVVSLVSVDIRRVEVKIDYNKTKEIVQYCLNGLLNLLQVDVLVTHKPKLRLLVVLQNNLNNIVHYKWKVHSEMQYIARAESNNIPLNLYDYVETAINDIEEENKINKTEVKNNDTNKTETNQVINDFYAEILNAIRIQNVTLDNNNNVSFNNEGPQIMNRRSMIDDLDIWEPDDDLESNTRRVKGGKPVGIHQYPFIASVLVLGQFTGSGSIINKNFVLTAGSCVQPSTLYKGDKSPIHVRIGSQHTASGGDLLPALAVIFHPHFDSVSLENNLAIIKVKNIMHSARRPAIKKIRIGNLPDKLPSNFAKKGVFVLGWRNTPDTIINKNQMSSAFLDITSLNECMNIYAKNLVTNRHFCAALIYRGSGACNADPGSPAIVSGTLVGLVNFGPPNCGTVFSPTVFTKLAAYSLWVKDVIKRDAQKIRYKTESAFVFEEAINDDFAKSPDDPEEILILRQLVHEIDKSNNTQSQIVEEDKESDDEMKILFKTTPTPAVDVPHHSLVNKSIVLVPGVHIPTYSTKSFSADVTSYMTVPLVDIGLPVNLPYDVINEYAHNSDELRYYIHDIMSHGNIFAQDEVNKYLGHDLRTEIKKKRDVESESNDNFEYESSEGLTIEAPINVKAEKIDPRSGEGGVLDLGDHNVKLDMRSNNKLPLKFDTDVWSEVMRLNELKKKRYNTWNERNNKDEPKRFHSIRIPNT